MTSPRSFPLPARPVVAGTAATTREPTARPRQAPGVADGHTLIAAKMSEAELDLSIRHLCTDLGLLRYHTHDARRSPAGFPDLVCAGLNGVLFRELKTQRGTVTGPQQQWLDVLAAAGQDAAVWRPEDLLSHRVARELATIAGLGGPHAA